MWTWTCTRLLEALAGSQSAQSPRRRSGHRSDGAGTPCDPHVSKLRPHPLLLPSLHGAKRRARLSSHLEHQRQPRPPKQPAVRHGVLLQRRQHADSIVSPCQQLKSGTRCWYSTVGEGCEDGARCSHICHGSHHRPILHPQPQRRHGAASDPMAVAAYVANKHCDESAPTMMPPSLWRDEQAAKSVSRLHATTSSRRRHRPTSLAAAFGGASGSGGGGSGNWHGPRASAAASQSAPRKLVAGTRAGSSSTRRRLLPATPTGSRGLSSKRGKQVAASSRARSQTLTVMKKKRDSAAAASSALDDDGLF